MKKIYLFLIFIFLSGVCSSQVRFGIRGGVSTIDVKPEDILITDGDDVHDLQLKLEDANYGVQFGLMFLIDVGALYIQPEFLYNSSKANYRIEHINDPNTPDDLFEEKYQYLDIPVMLGLRAGPLRFGAGPVGHVYLSSTSSLLDFDGYKQDFKQMTFGWQGGIGLDLWNLHFDVRYEGNFNNFGDHFNFNGNTYSFSNTPTRFIGAIGLSF